MACHISSKNLIEQIEKFHTASASDLIYSFIPEDLIKNDLSLAQQTALHNGYRFA
jgi:hypothetical protein